MKNQKTKLLAVIVAAIVPLMGYSQTYHQYFDGADTSSYYSIFMQLDTSSTNVWQIGPPNKLIFDSAATAPNALVTDTLLSYPTNSFSSFTYDIPNNGFPMGIMAIQWIQKLDMDPGMDGGLVEYSRDKGQTWINAFNSPEVYNFYGFDSINVDTLPNGEMGFTGTDSTWKDIWLCFDYSWLNNYDSVLIRHTLVSDSVDQNREGWIMDNFLVHITMIHTVNEVDTKEYMTVGPNPTQGRVELVTKKREGYHVIENMELVNAEGKVVQNWGLSPTKYFIDISNQPNGIYFLRVKTNIQTETFKIILDK